MRGLGHVTCACALMLAAYPHPTMAQSSTAAPSAGAGSAAAAQGKSGAPAGELLQARYAWGVDPAKRCPELRQTHEGAVAVVQFLVGSTGVPSKVSVRESSGSDSFDAAATSCVLKLHFLPATRLGDAVAIESWQQLVLKSAGPASAPQAARCDPAASGHAGETGGSVVGTDAQGANDRKREQPGPTTARAGVCVCVDETGKLTQPPVLTSSSGIAAFDKAALELSGAANYRPSASSSGQPTPGCFRFKVGLDVK